MFPENKKYDNAIKRENTLYKRENDIRTEFYRDYSRLLHSSAYSRLKHKTQVFFATQNDHICTRMEHVNHVASVSYTIANYLGLNTELVLAIATGHDIGHAPFGHKGEEVLSKITKKHLHYELWHEKNSLRVADKLELLQDNRRKSHNLTLTYAVRDGIICHCGEVDQAILKPRKDNICLDSIKKKGEVEAYIWEGCVVKIADKISYLGRDIDDAFRLNILNKENLYYLMKLVNDVLGINNNANTSALIHMFITDICQNSSPEEGIMLSDRYKDLMKKIKEFNYTFIYGNSRLNHYKHYAELIINSIFNELYSRYTQNNTIDSLHNMSNDYPILGATFLKYLSKKSLFRIYKYENEFLEPNEKLYNCFDEKSYITAIIDYISTITDHFAIDLFHELTSFR